MSGARSRTKGHSFERLIARYFKLIGFPEAQRQLEYQINQAQGIDLAGTGNFKVQCKKTKKYVSMNTILEVKVSSLHDVPVLIAQGDNQAPLVTMRLEDFLFMAGGNMFYASTEDLKKAMKDIRG